VPVSEATEPTPNSLMPHGTIRRKSDKSVLKLKAKPCIVTQREMRTPMAPIFTGVRAAFSPGHTLGSAWSAHKPMYSSIVPVSMP